MLKIITWNVNSINVRLERLLALIAREQPDIICLQELKCIDEKFPTEKIQEAGFHCLVLGQKTYNGVAILSKEPIKELTRGFQDTGDDSHSRFLGGETFGLSVFSAYVPNGQFVGSEKYAYKLEWLKRLRKYLDLHFGPKDKLVVAGDFNVAPEDIDVHDPDLWHEKILCSSQERLALKDVMDFGLVDLYRELYPKEKAFSWWDYRQLAFQKNLGLRIDLILGTKSIEMTTKEVTMIREERKGVQPSDHAPVAACLEA
jgi:exodeoxyribonuclease III